MPWRLPFVTSTPQERFGVKGLSHFEPPVYFWSFLMRWPGIAALMSALGLAAVAFASSGQEPNRDPASAATITFSLNFPQSDPQNYTIKIDARGQARYECTGPVVPDSDSESYHSQFEITPQTRDKIFELAKQAHYFTGKIDSGNRRLAFTGTKILTYEDAQHDNKAQYDYSNVAPVRDLTSLFQGMAATLEYGRRLVYYHRYQKLGLDDELKRMEEDAKNNELSELQSVAPILQDIVNDASVINVTRARAQELMEMSGGNGVVAGHTLR
jgi:hypothetical protein